MFLKYYHPCKSVIWDIFWWMPPRCDLLKYQIVGFEIMDSYSSDNLKVLTFPLSGEAPFRASNAALIFCLHYLYSQISVCHFHLPLWEWQALS